MPVERTTDQTGEAQRNVFIGLVKDFDAVLADVAVLAQVAKVERAHDGFAFDEHTRVGELEILGFREAANTALEPVAAALAGEAGGVAGDGGDCRCCSGRTDGREVANVGAGFGVLNVVAKYNKREARVRSLNVKSCDGVEKSELGSELPVRNGLDASRARGGNRKSGHGVNVYVGHDIGDGGGSNGVLDAGTGKRKEPVERSLRIAARDSSGESDRIRIVIVVESAVGAQFDPAAQLPYGLDLATVHFAFHAAPVYPGSVLDLGERQRKPDDGKSPDDRRTIVKIPLQGLRDPFWVKVVIPGELRAIERISNFTAGEHQRLELVGSVSDERAINGDRLAGIELDVRLVGRNRIIQIAGGQREPAADVVVEFCVDIKAKAEAHAIAHLGIAIGGCARPPDEGLIAHAHVAAEAEWANGFDPSIEGLLLALVVLVKRGNFLGEVTRSVRNGLQLAFRHLGIPLLRLGFLGGRCC